MSYLEAREVIRCVVYKLGVCFPVVRLWFGHTTIVNSCNKEIKGLKLIKKDCNLTFCKMEFLED